MNSLYTVEGVIGAVGGAVFAQTEKYLQAGMENEDFYGWGLEGRINYDRLFGKHRVGALFLYNQRNYQVAAGSSIDALPYRDQGLAGQLL